MADSTSEELLTYEAKSAGWSSRVEVRANSALFITRDGFKPRRDEVDLRTLHERPTLVEGTAKRRIGIGVGLAVTVLGIVLEIEKWISANWFFGLTMLGSAILFGYFFLPVGVWAYFTNHIGTQFGVMKGSDEAEFDRFLGEMENRILRSKGEAMVYWVHQVRKLRCDSDSFWSYRELLSRFETTAPPPHYPRIQLLGQTPEGDYVERWSFYSHEAHQACEEWLRETSSGQKFAKQWTDVGAQPGEFEDWTVRVRR